MAVSAEAFAVSLRLMRAGNNETGTKVSDGDLSFGDPGLPKVLMPGSDPASGSSSSSAKSSTSKKGKTP